MKKLFVGGFPEKGVKLTNANQVFHLKNLENIEIFYIIAEEFGQKNLEEFLSFYQDPRPLYVYSKRMPVARIKKVFDKIKDCRKEAVNPFQAANSMKNPMTNPIKKLEKIKASKAPSRLIAKLMTKTTSSPQKAILLAKADLYDRPEILTVLYTKR